MIVNRGPVLDKPIAFHWESVPAGNSPSELINRLSLELDSERKRNLQLLQDLTIEKQRVFELESYLVKVNLANPTAKFPVLGESSVLTLDFIPFSSETAATQGEEATGPMIGAYSLSVRREKIARYKQKQSAHRAKIRVSRNYRGRSSVAQLKPRTNGRFSKAEP